MDDSCFHIRFYLKRLLVAMSLSDDDELPSLKKGSFAAVLDGDHTCRDRLRRGSRGQLLRWLKNEEGTELVGQQSMATIALNVRPLTLLAKYWCPKAKKTLKSPSIQLIRDEAGFVKTIHCKFPQKS